jgi:hypothetical protein
VLIARLQSAQQVKKLLQRRIEKGEDDEKKHVREQYFSTWFLSNTDVLLYYYILLVFLFFFFFFLTGLISRCVSHSCVGIHSPAARADRAHQRAERTHLHGHPSRRGSPSSLPHTAIDHVILRCPWFFSPSPSPFHL